MRRQPTRDTAPEMALRRALHRRGLRYRLQRRLVPGTRRTVDIAFIGPKVAVDVRGCWWHGCELHAQKAINNSAWWSAKLARNVARDLETERLLTSAGWHVIIVWEHDPVDQAAALIEDVVRSRRWRNLIVPSTQGNDGLSP